MTVEVLVVGGGRIGAALARRMVDAGQRVVVLERDAGRVAELSARLPEVTVVAGDGTDPAVLEAAGVRTATVVVVVTGDDARNLVVAALARFGFEVPRTIAQVVEPDHAWLFAPDLGVDVAVDQAEVLTGLISEEVAVGDVITLVELHRGELTLVEERVTAGSHAAGGTIGDLQLTDACAAVAVLRGDEVLVARRGLRLHAGDDVLAVAKPRGAAELARALAGDRGGC